MGSSGLAHAVVRKGLLEWRERRERIEKGGNKEGTWGQIGNRKGREGIEGEGREEVESSEMLGEKRTASQQGEEKREQGDMEITW